jgi:urease beta subunit
MDTVIDPKIKAMKRLYNAEIDVYKAEVQNYLDNPVGVGEHGNLIETMDTLVAKIAESAEKLDILERYFGEDL